MKLKATRQEYELADESGYKFQVVAEYDPERGWTAHVSIRAGGYRTEMDAVERVVEHAEQFVRMAKEGA